MTLHTDRGDHAVDVHHHMFPPELVSALSAGGTSRIGGEPVAAWWSPERSLELMDRYGIAAAVLSVPVPLGFLDELPDGLNFGMVFGLLQEELLFQGLQLVKLVAHDALPLIRGAPHHLL